MQTPETVASSPPNSPHRARKWRAFAGRVIARSRRNQLTGWAAQAAFFFTLAFFPLLYCLFMAISFISTDRAELRSLLLSYLATLMPGSAFELLAQTLERMTRRNETSGLSLGLLAAVWVASSGMNGIVRALNATFDLTERRSWFYERGKALVLTFALGAFIITALFILLYGGTFLSDAGKYFANLDAQTVHILGLFQYPLVIVLVLLVFDALYYFAPNLKGRRWRWWTLGALVGVAMWIAASWWLSIYLTYLSRIRTVYGHFGSVIGLMLWFYMTSIAILVGAEINAELEANRKALGGESASELPNAEAISSDAYV